MIVHSGSKAGTCVIVADDKHDFKQNLLYRKYSTIKSHPPSHFVGNWMNSKCDACIRGQNLRRMLSKNQHWWNRRFFPLSSIEAALYSYSNLRRSILSKSSRKQLRFGINQCCTLVYSALHNCSNRFYNGPYHCLSREGYLELINSRELCVITLRNTLRYGVIPLR